MRIFSAFDANYAPAYAALAEQNLMEGCIRADYFDDGFVIG